MAFVFAGLCFCANRGMVAFTSLTESTPSYHVLATITTLARHPGFSDLDYGCIIHVESTCITLLRMSMSCVHHSSSRLPWRIARASLVRLRAAEGLGSPARPSSVSIPISLPLNITPTPSCETCLQEEATVLNLSCSIYNLNSR